MKVTLALALCACSMGAAAQDGQGIIWGKPLDGLRVGVEIGSGKTTYRHGEVLGIRIHLQNSGDGPVKLALKSPRNWHPNLSTGGLITLNSTAGDSRETLLDPGQSTLVEGSEAEFVILAPGTAPEKGRKALQLAAGEYRLRVTTPLWTQDLNNANSATGLRAVPGPVTLKVLGEPLRILTGKTVRFRRGQGLMRALDPDNGNPKDAPISRTEPAWGEPVNGIQAGIRFSAPGSVISLGASVKTELLIRNVTELPLTVTYPAYASYDYYPTVKNAKGERANVQSTFVSGLRAMASDTLAPGEAIVIGEPAMEIHLKPRAGQGFNTVLEAEPGSYRVQFHANVRPVDGFDLILMTGQLDMEVRQAVSASSPR